MFIETISEPKQVKARKTHICNWCGCSISVGEAYNTATYKYDNIYTWKSHLKCMELVNTLDMEGDEGVTGEDFHEYITEEFSNIWRELDNELYESDEFVIPEFKQQVAFVYEKRCGEKGNVI